MQVRQHLLHTSRKRIFLIAILSFFYCTGFSQIRFPKDFKLIEGTRGGGEDDKYSNGRYAFDTHTYFVSYEGSRVADSIKTYLTHSFGFPFFITRDGLFWGTGKADGLYSYVVVTPDNHIIELYSMYNDKGFSYYSKWLLSTIREYIRKGKDTHFPLRGE